MQYEEKFIQERYNRYQLMKYLEIRLERAGLANVEIQRTPLMTRINLEVLNPARIIGRKGKLINELTDEIKKTFSIDNPQISVVEVREPLLEPCIVARKIVRYIEMGKKVRAVLHFFLREILSRGAMGAEIVASGKIGAKGARAKSLRFSAGYIPTAGEPSRLVHIAHFNANTKSGVIGILVRIVAPGTVFPDKKTNGQKEDVPAPAPVSTPTPAQVAPTPSAAETKPAEEKKPAVKKTKKKEKAEDVVVEKPEENKIKEEEKAENVDKKG